MPVDYMTDEDSAYKESMTKEYKEKLLPPLERYVGKTYKKLKLLKKKTKSNNAVREMYKANEDDDTA
jgi:hypothetical protein